MNTSNKIQDLYDIYGMWHMPFWQTKAFWGTMVTFFVILLVAIVGYLLFRCCRRKKTQFSWDKALYELSGLTIDVEPTKEHGKQFYFSLTAILKTYLNERYKIMVQGKTDQELLLLLEQSSLPSDLLPFIRTILTGCLQIKYADEQALRKQLICDLDNAVILIKQTSQTDCKE